MQTETKLSQEYTIPTPENVSFGYEVVGIGNRFIATLIDSLILFLLLLAINILLALALDSIGELNTDLLDSANEVSWSAGLFIAIYSLLYFIVFWGYYIGFEMAWQGQTPGKRWVKIRAVRIDGNPVGFGEVAIRNLVRVIDFLPISYALGLATMFFSPNARRLGDYAAGTIVIKDKSLLTLNELSSTYPTPRNEPYPIDEADPLYTRYSNIRALTKNDHELIVEVLNRHDHNRIDAGLLAQVTNRMRQKLQLDPAEVSILGNRKLLEEITEAYRRYA